MRRIVVPQSMSYLVPTMTNQVIGLIKESAALAIITVPELSMASQKVVGETFRPVETYLITDRDTGSTWLEFQLRSGPTLLIREDEHDLLAAGDGAQ